MLSTPDGCRTQLSWATWATLINGYLLTCMKTTQPCLRSLPSSSIGIITLTPFANPLDILSTLEMSPGFIVQKNSENFEKDSTTFNHFYPQKILEKSSICLYFLEPKKLAKTIHFYYHFYNTNKALFFIHFLDDRIVLKNRYPNFPFIFSYTNLNIKTRNLSQFLHPKICYKIQSLCQSFLPQKNLLNVILFTIILYYKESFFFPEFFALQKWLKL